MSRKNKFFNKRTERIAIITAVFLVFLLAVAVLLERRIEYKRLQMAEEEAKAIAESQAQAAAAAISEVEPEEIPDEITSWEVSFDTSWMNAENAVITSGKAVLWKAKPSISNGLTVCINAGHGTAGGESVRTLCHPDGTQKVTGGTTSEGSSTAYAVSSGTELADGTSEAQATLSAARTVKELLLENGYNVLMIRDEDDVQLDNIARTLIANHYADAHISIHYDSTDWDKGVFFMSVPSSAEYRSMEPVASHWEQHNALGRAVVSAIEKEGFTLFEGGEMEMDLTQTSYSEIPSIDLEIGDTKSDHSDTAQSSIAEGILNGLNNFFMIGGSDSGVESSVS